MHNLYEKNREQSIQLIKLFNCLFDKINYYDSKVKFNTLAFILNNKFITTNDKAELCIMFSRMQFIYGNINKFINIYKFKKAKFYDCNHDLNFEPLEQVKEYHKITILQNNTKYIFKITDLVNIINKSITNCPDMFVEPLDIKNPYTNIPFSKADLYNIYFKINKTQLAHSLLFNCYFKCNFNKNEFSNKYEQMILDEYLKNNFKELTIDKKYKLAIELLRKYKKTSTAMRMFDLSKITRVQPYTIINKSLVVEKFNTCIEKYIFVKHSLNQSLRYQYERDIIKYIASFADNNKDFTAIVKKKYYNNKSKTKQIIFGPLKQLNKFSFDISNEIVIDVSCKNNKPYIFTSKSKDSTFVFKYPIIKSKVSKEFIRKNEENIINSRMLTTKYNNYTSDFNHISGIRRRLNFNDLNSETRSLSWSSTTENVQSFMDEMMRLINNPQLINVPPTPLSYQVNRVNIEFNIDDTNSQNNNNDLESEDDSTNNYNDGSENEYEEDEYEEDELDDEDYDSL